MPIYSPPPASPLPRPLAEPDGTPPVALIAAVRAEPKAMAAIGTAAAWTPLSGGRVNRLWRVGEAVVKLYDLTAASPLYPNDPRDEASALLALSPSGLAPDLFGQGAGWIAYRYVPGHSWTGEGIAARPTLEGMGGEERPFPIANLPATDAEAVERLTMPRAMSCTDTPEGAARLLGRLHAQPVAGLPFRWLASGATALLEQGSRILRDCAAPLPPPGLAGPGPVAHRVVLHGDAVPGNIIAGPQGLTLIDWQCPALGDAAEDLAAFLSPAMQWLYRGRPLTEDEAGSFLGGYPDRATVARYLALAPLFRWRMAAHCLWRASRGTAGYAEAARLELQA